MLQNIRPIPRNCGTFGFYLETRYFWLKCGTVSRNAGRVGPMIFRLKQLTACGRFSEQHGRDARQNTHQDDKNGHAGVLTAIEESVV